MRTTIIAVAAGLTLTTPSATADSPAPHPVTIHVASLTHETVAFRVTRRAARFRTEPAKTLGETSHFTPADVVIGADAAEVEIATNGNQSVRVTFQADGSEREKAQSIWGRLILLRNDGDDLMLQPRTLNIVPTARGR